MIQDEYRTQIIMTKNQWESGLLYRLEMPEDGGITQRSIPGFAQWIIPPEATNPAALAVDECSQVFFMEQEGNSKLCKLYRYDPASQNSELLSHISGCCHEQGKTQCPSRMILDRFNLLVNDAEKNRVIAFSRENYQIKFIINKYFINDKEESIEPIDIGLDRNGFIYLLDGRLNKNQIIKYGRNGNYVKPPIDLKIDGKKLAKPVGFVLDGKNNLWVIDEKKLLKFKEEDSKYVLEFTTNLSSIYAELDPSYITIDGKGNIFISDINGLIYQFDPDGSSTGKIPFPLFKGNINGITTDKKNNLYASSVNGIAVFNIKETFTKERGVYYSKTLDSGIQECQWHRFTLKANVPPGAALEVYYYSSDNTELKRILDEILSGAGSIQEKAKSIEDAIPEWTGPETISKEKSEKSKNMLFREKTGRYLWLKIVLLTFNEKVRPSITQMRVFYPRNSYLRYLPAIYQEDPASRNFLERFLSIFETVVYDNETEINSISRYFDPGTIPKDFLTWLASWLNVALEEEWHEGKKRQFIQEAYLLYQQKGTPAGIERLIYFYTGKKPILLEHSKTGKPMILTEEGSFRLGIISVLTETPIRGFRLGDESILGRVALRDTVQSPEDPFLPMAHRFTVTLDLSDEEITRFEKGLRRIIDEEKPAHTMYSLRFTGGMKEKWTYVGINTKLDSHKYIKLGAGAIGAGILAENEEKGGKVEQRSRVGLDAELI